MWTYRCLRASIWVVILVVVCVSVSRFAACRLVACRCRLRYRRARRSQRRRRPTPPHRAHSRPLRRTRCHSLTRRRRDRSREPCSDTRTSSWCVCVSVSRSCETIVHGRARVTYARVFCAAQVTGTFGGNSEKGVMKKAVIFHARDGRLSVATPAQPAQKGMTRVASRGVSLKVCCFSV